MSNEQKIWESLKSKGLNDYAVAGIMGNLYAESGLNPQNLQNSYEKSLKMTDEEYTAAVDSGKYSNFIKDSAGYGLAQWTYWSRKQALLNYKNAYGTSIGDLDMQLGFLWQEIQGYAAVMKVLKTATSVRDASDAVLLNYERPANQGETVRQKRAAYGQAYYDKYAAAVPEKDTQKGAGAMAAEKITTAKQLVERAVQVAKNYKTLYVMGCFGAPMTDKNKERYCKNHSYNKQAARQKMIKEASADTFGFDCVNLIKGLLWGWCGDKSKTYGGAAYASNKVPDTNANGMIKLCKDVSTDFSKIPVGAAVWLEGHIGIYIGDGLAVECTPAWKNCVQITAVKNIGDKSGYNSRKWTKYGKLPFISYDAEKEPVQQPVKEQEREPVKETAQQTAQQTNYKVGDIVTFTGTKHYTNANAATAKSCKGGEAKVTALAKGKHPIHLIHTGKGCTVYGWVDLEDIKGAESSAATPKLKSTDEIAKEVILGRWGNGAERKRRLEAAGYSYAVVQQRVNELCKK